MVLTREDVWLVGPLAAIRKATAERIAATPEAEPSLAVPYPAPAQ
jgi:hypothetical protein